MSERNSQPGAMHPVIRLVAENPISALNAAMILIGGGVVWATNESRVAAVELRIANVERSLEQAGKTAADAGDKTSARIEAITRDVGDVKITVRGIEAAVQFLVQQERRRPRE